MKELRRHKWLYGARETGLLHQGALRAVGIDMDQYKGQFAFWSWMPEAGWVAVNQVDPESWYPWGHKGWICV